MGKNDKLYQVSFLLEKLYNINKELGGYSIIKNKLNYTENKFEVLFIECQDKIMQIKQIQKTQDQDLSKTKANQNSIIQKYQIKNILNDCQVVCTQLFEFQNKKYKDLKRQVEKIVQEFDVDNTIINLDDIEFGQKPTNQSERDQQNILDINKHAKRIQKLETDKIEQSCLKNIEKNNKIQEEILENMYQKVTYLQNKVNEIERQQIQIGSQVEKQNKNFQKTNTILDNQTQRMKNLVTELIKPNKFCLDITLILFIIGLIGILWQMLK
ncbi:hypothetical protein ABPG72_016780 [Tetrahymena utriculariae]